MAVVNGPVRESYDAVVAGSGAAGLMAALVLAEAGRSVLVVEKAPSIGGTSAISGGMLWIPDNPSMRELGIADDREAALCYLRAITRGRTPERNLRGFLESGPAMLAFAAEAADLQTYALPNFPDYQRQLEGSLAGGRSLEPRLFDLGALGESRSLLRGDDRLPFTMLEYEQWKAFTRFRWEELEQRKRDGLGARGLALVAPLLTGCERRGVTIATEMGLAGVVPAAGGGLTARLDAGTEVRARRGVVLATGGFERNAAMVAAFLGDRLRAACGPPTNTGDGIRIGQRLGAQIANMAEAWWVPMVNLPGDLIDGAQAGTLLRFERNGPGTLIVGRHGRRFVNEAQNYNEMTRVLHDYDPDVRGPRHLPAWLLFDQRHLEQYGFLSHRAGRSLPPWLICAEDWASLAAKLDLPEATLLETIDRFNGHVREGRDPDFGRGDSEYDRYWGDAEAPHPTLGTLEQPPYYAVEVVPGALGTNGGLQTDEWGRVVDVDGQPIAGLYAAGNTTAHPMGPGYAGAGATLGPGLTMAYRAGRSLTGDGG